MSTPILATKLYVPQPRAKVVSRSRLIERLNEALHRKVTLLSAPAGFGKTTLVSEWLTSARQLPTAEPAQFQERRVAWLSLDEGDSDPTRFLAYFVAALQTIVPNLGEGVLAVLHAAQPAPIESILTSLLNEIALIPDPFVLVLDDYHVIDSRVIDQALTFLLEHLPPQMHLVITTREDPNLSLSRLRARGQMTEVRAADLRFSLAEAAQFLNQLMGLDLSTGEISTLEERTEGWIAGLQLAALSMQGHQDVAGFIQGFAGDHRYIVDYLIEEVLQRQPEAVRHFLLQTAILEQLNGSLCAAVTGQADSSARLEALERRNFFVVPLDNKRHWYRYHHLFADVLQARLMEEQPEQIALLHQRASVWYEKQGSTPDAIRHALAAQDFARVADLLEDAMPAMGRSREGPTFLGWLKALPTEIIYARPVLCVGYGWSSMASGELDAVEPWLQRADWWLESLAETGAHPHPEGSWMVVANEEEFRRLPGTIARYRAGLAQLLGNIADTAKYAQQALDIVPEEDVLGRGAGMALLGLALWASGDLETAYQTYAAGMARVQQAGNIFDVINSANYRAGIRIAQGRLRDAMSIYEQSMLFATQQGDSHLQATADHYVGMAELQYEHNNLDAAMQCLSRSKEVSERSILPHNRSRWCVVMAQIRQAQGDPNGALELLDEAERLYVRDFIPNVRPVAAYKARMWIAQGRLAEALGWAREQGLSAQDDLSYLREFEHITLARLLLARYQSDHTDHSLLEAMGLLARLLQAAEAAGRIGSVIEILVLQALAHQRQGDIPAALAALERGLTLAEPEGYIRIFAEEGSPMAQLLEKAAQRAIAPHYLRQLLTALGKGGDGGAINQVLIAPRTQSAIAQPQFAIEPLSERELEVLRLLGTELSGPEIANQLMVSLNTMHTHTKNIYSKLGVNNRRAALRRAEELHLV